MGASSTKSQARINEMIKVAITVKTEHIHKIEPVRLKKGAHPCDGTTDRCVEERKQVDNVNTKQQVQHQKMGSKKSNICIVSNSQLI